MNNIVQKLEMVEDTTVIAGDFVIVNSDNKVRPATEEETLGLIGIALDSKIYTTDEENKIRVWLPKKIDIIEE